MIYYLFACFNVISNECLNALYVPYTYVIISVNQDDGYYELLKSTIISILNDNKASLSNPEGP